MKIGIIGAMDLEVATLKEQMQIEKTSTAASMEFCEGKLGGKDVVVVKCGVGKVNAGICTQILCDLYGVSHIINTGVAGSLQARIDIGDIVISTDAIQHDMDVTALSYEYGQIPGLPVKAFVADEILRKVALASCKKVNQDIQVFEGRVLSGDQFISSAEKKKFHIDTFGEESACTEMEGASIAQVAYLNQKPFVIIRAISDKADDSAEMDYPTFEHAAALHSAGLVMEMMKEL